MTCNYHTHTYRCGHASGTEREYIETAIERGLTTLGFSDHCPMVFPSGFKSHFRIPVELLEDYIKTLTALKEEYKDRIEIFIGFELEYYPALFQSTLELLQPYDYDYLIMGQHFVNNEEGEIYNSVSFENEDKLERYVDQVIEGMQTGKFTYLAHPDVIGFFGDEDIYYKHMRRMCVELKKLNIPLEFNLLGFGEKRIYPSERFFKIAKEIGNDVIIGCDAHHAANVADPVIVSEAEEFLKALGIIPIESVKLRDPKK